MNTVAKNRVALPVVLAVLACQIAMADSGQSRTPSEGALIPGGSALKDSLAARDWEAVRWWFHRPGFHVPDALEDYGDYYNNGTDGILIDARPCSP